MAPAEYFRDQTGTVKVLGWELPALEDDGAGVLVFPQAAAPGPDVSLTYLLGNERNYNLKPVVKNAANGGSSNITVEQSGDAVTLSITGAALNDEFDLTLTLESSDGVRDLADIKVPRLVCSNPFTTKPGLESIAGNPGDPLTLTLAPSDPVADTYEVYYRLGDCIADEILAGTPETVFTSAASLSLVSGETYSMVIRAVKTGYRTTRSAVRKVRISSDIDWSGDSTGLGWSYDSEEKLCTLHPGAEITINGPPGNGQRIEIAGGPGDPPASLTLNGAEIQGPIAANPGSTPPGKQSPLSIAPGAALILNLLPGTTTLTATNRGAGIHVPAGASLTINAPGDGTGKLFAYGGGGSYNPGGAGIGGGWGETCGTVIINGGSIYAESLDMGAGIGGGNNGGGGTITINGGVVWAKAPSGNNAPAAIGAGGGDSSNRQSGIITITGGVVICEAGSTGAAAIGGSVGSGYPAPLPNQITISGGTIIMAKNIGQGNNHSTTVNLSGNPVIFAPGINGYNNDTSQGRLVGGDYSLNTGAKTITINTNFTVPAGATFTIPPDWTVNLNGKTLTNSGTVNNLGTFRLNGGTVNGGGTWNGNPAQP